MKTAILFALVCLLGYTAALDSQTCEESCKAIANLNFGVVSIGGGISIAVEKDKFVASIGAQFGFIVFTGTDNISMLISKDSNAVLYIKGSKCVSITSSHVSGIFSDKAQISEAIVEIQKEVERAEDTAKGTFNFSVLVQKGDTIDFTLLITGNDNVSNSVKNNFGAVLLTVKKTIDELGSASVSIHVLVAVSFDSTVSVTFVQAFALTLQSHPDMVGINNLLEAHINNKLSILVALLKIRDVENTTSYKIITKSLEIKHKLRELTLVYGNGNFYLEYSTVGVSSSTITLFISRSINVICISNSYIGYTLIIKGDLRILFNHFQGVGLIFNGAMINIINADTIGVSEQGAVINAGQLIAFAISSQVTAQVNAGVTISIFVNACASGSATALITAFSKVSASVVTDVFTSFGKLFAGFKNLLGVIHIDVSYCARLCLISSSSSSIVSVYGGGVIDVFVSSISAVITSSFGIFSATCNSALSVMFSVEIRFGGSVTIG